MTSPEDASLGPVPWVESSHETLAFNGKATADIRVNNPNVKVNRGEAKTRLTVHTDRQDIVVSGNVGGAAELTIVGPRLRNLTVAAPFENVVVRESETSCSATLTPTVTAVELNAAKWTLKRPNRSRQADRTALDRVTIEAGRHAHLGGDVPFQALEGVGDGTIDVALPSQDGSEWRVQDRLNVNRQPGADATITARHVHLQVDVVGITVEGQNAQTVERVDGKLIKNSTVLASQQVNVARLESTRVECDGPIHVAEKVAGGELTSRVQDGIAIRVGATNNHDSVVIPDADELLWETLPQPNGVGDVDGAHLTVVGSGDISAVSLTGTTVETQGKVRAYDGVTLADGAIQADALIASAVTLRDSTPSRIRVGELWAERIRATGTLACRHQLWCRHLDVLQPEDSAEEAPHQELAITAEKVELLETVSGTVDICTSESLQASLTRHDESDLAPVTARVEGRVELVGGQLAELVTTKRTIVHARGCDILAAVLAPDALVYLQDGASIDAGEVSGRCNLVLDFAPDLSIDLMDKPHLNVHRPHEELDPGLSATKKAIHESLREQQPHGEPRANFHLPSDADLRIRRPGDTKGAAHRSRLFISERSGETSDTQWDLTLESLQGGERYALSAPPTDGYDASPDVTVEGPISLALDGTVRMLAATNAPEIDLLSASTTVYRGVGTVTLGQRFLGTLHGQTNGGASLKVVGVAPPPEGASDQSRSARLLDVDITGLQADDIERLTPIVVLDPTPTSLRKFATSNALQSVTEEGKRAELRERAERASRIVAALRNRSVSGSSRANAHWAAARLHHRALRPWSGEWILRKLYQAFGYGQRPGIAVMTWLAAIAIVVAIQVGHHLLGDLKEPLAFVELLQKTAVTSLVLPRLTDDIAPLSDAPLLQAVAVTFMTVPFIYFLIALKNFLSPPGAKTTR